MLNSLLAIKKLLKPILLFIIVKQHHYTTKNFITRVKIKIYLNVNNNTLYIQMNCMNKYQFNKNTFKQIENKTLKK